jgi:hypothetical protein
LVYLQDPFSYFFPFGKIVLSSSIYADISEAWRDAFGANAKIYGEPGDICLIRVYSMEGRGMTENQCPFLRSNPDFSLDSVVVSTRGKLLPSM